MNDTVKILRRIERALAAGRQLVDVSDIGGDAPKRGERLDALDASVQELRREVGQLGADVSAVLHKLGPAVEAIRACAAELTGEGAAELEEQEVGS